MWLVYKFENQLPPFRVLVAGARPPAIAILRARPARIAEELLRERQAGPVLGSMMEDLVRKAVDASMMYREAVNAHAASRRAPWPRVPDVVDGERALRVLPPHHEKGRRRSDRHVAAQGWIGGNRRIGRHARKGRGMAREVLIMRALAAGTL